MVKQEQASFAKVTRPIIMGVFYRGVTSSRDKTSFGSDYWNRKIMMRRLTWNNKALVLFVTLNISLLSQNTAFAGAPVHGSKAASMGTAFVAIADDPSAILYNPAGLTQLTGTNTYSGATAVIPTSEYESPSGESDETDFQVFFPPHLYISSDLNTETIALGLGVFSPFGIGGRKWGEDGPTRYISTESTIATISVNPTFAWEITPSLSVGLAFTCTPSTPRKEGSISLPLGRKMENSACMLMGAAGDITLAFFLSFRIALV